MRSLFLCLAMLFSAQFALASDHIDGKEISGHPLADGSDFYFFPSPNKENHVVLVMNTHYAAYSENHFNPGLIYKFHLYQAEADKDGRSIVKSNPKAISCEFTLEESHDGHSHGKDEMICKSDFGLSFQGPIEESFEREGVSAFAGLRSDPFFFNAFWVGPVTTEGRIPSPWITGDTMDKLNVLSIALEIDLEEIYPGSEKSLLAAAISVHNVNDDGSQKDQLDFIGRPEITNFTLGKNNVDLRDDYNKAAVGSLAIEQWSDFHQQVFDNVKLMDGADEKEDWTEEDLTDFSKILIDDVLVLDVSKPCLGYDENYMNIEYSLMDPEKQEHSSCGGRRLEDDFVDIMLSYYIRKDGGVTFGDGIDAPHKETLSEFPYLNEPSIGFWAYKAMKQARLLGSWFN
ncbi:MAG: DUF4331 family protein [Pseudomonadota bacterium]